MQGQVLYAPKLTPSQIESRETRKTFREKLVARAVASPSVPPNPAPAPVNAQASEQAPLQPAIPNQFFQVAWGLLNGRRNHKGEPKFEIIKRAVCAYFGNLTRIDLESARRTQSVVRPRQIAMWLCKNLTTRSLPEIGRSFGGRDHTTALHAVRKIDSERLVNSSLQNDLDLLQAAINNDVAGVANGF